MGQITNPFQSGGSSTVTSFERWAGAAIVSPPALAAGVTNNYNPGGLATGRLLRLTPNAAGSDLSGIFFLPGHLLTLVNLAALAGPNVRLLNLNGGSAVGNQFTLTGAIFVISPQDYITLFGDVATGKWRLVA